MNIDIIKRICLARHLYELGCDSIRSANDLHLFSGVNLLQDAVEAFLVALADFVGASLDERTAFDRYFALINEKIEPKELPFKNKLIRLNKMRVDSKHHGIQPERNECQRVSLAVREFFEEVSSSIMGINFSTISAIDLLESGETKDHLLTAKKALEENNYKACAIECRKAIYLELEYWYDISKFKEDKPLGFLGSYSKAPIYARNKEYIEKYVSAPTDFIVYNHSDLNQELLTYSIDTTAFWNIWRLTPEIYRNKDNQWIVKYDFNKLDSDVLKENIVYIFNTTVDIFLAIHSKKASIKFFSHETHQLELDREEVPVYDKADVNSKEVCKTPKGIKELDFNYYILGFEADGPYWHVSYFSKTKSFIGFIHNNYVKGIRTTKTEG